MLAIWISNNVFVYASAKLSFFPVNDASLNFSQCIRLDKQRLATSNKIY